MRPSSVCVVATGRILTSVRFNTIDEAKKMCPHLVVQHVATYRNGEAEAGYWGEVDPRTHKVSLDPYRRESLKILAIFKEMVPRGEIEKASIDEAFLDLSTQVVERLLVLHPFLASVPDDAPDGLDSQLPPAPPIDWSKAGNVFPIGDIDDAGGHEEVDGDGPRSSQGGPAAGPGWEDWALCLGAEIMSELRAEVFKRLHYTCSAGIAHNKAMAKLCSSWKKPNNQTVLRMAATPNFLRDMDFTDIRFLGGKLGSAIANEYNAKTVGDMLIVPLDELQRRFGEESLWVYNIIRGVDHTEVKERVATKSMLASKNTRPSVTTPEQGLHWINVLAGELNVRLREAREVAPGLWPKTLVLSHRTGGEGSRSRQTPFPFTRHLSTEYIVKYAKKLWDEVTQPMQNGAGMKLNNMALAFNGLERLEGGQQGIEGFFGSGQVAAKGTVTPTKSDKKRSRSSSPIPVVLDPQPVAARPTSSSTADASPLKKTRLPTLHTGKERRKTALDTFLANRKTGESSTTPTPPPPAHRSNSPAAAVAPRLHVPDTKIIDDYDTEAKETLWTCAKCGKHFTPPPDAESGARMALLADLKQEHEDYHFALELQEGGPTPRKAPAAKVKKKTKPEGIKAFFAPKGQ